MKPKLGYNFSLSIHRFKTCILERWFRAVYTSRYFPIHKRDGKLGFFNVGLGCTAFFPIDKRVWKSGILKSPCRHFLSDSEDSLSGTKDYLFKERLLKWLAVVLHEM